MALFGFAACGGKTLPAPDGLYAADGILSWDPVKNAASYDVLVDGDAPFRVTGNEFSLAYLNGRGEISVSIRAVAKAGYNDSEYSRPFMYTATAKLGVPENLSVNYENRFVMWDAADNALYYEVQLDNGEPARSDEVYFDFGDMTVGPGGHAFKVRACGDGVCYKASDFSEKPFWVFDPGAVSEGLSFKYVDDLGGYEVSMGTATGQAIVIPPEKDSKPVVKIADYGFRGSAGVLAVIIPDSVYEIGERAFEGCENLYEISMSENLAVLGLSAFDGTAFHEGLSAGAHYFGKVFYTYKGVIPVSGVIEIKDGTLSVAPRAFFGQRYLTSVRFPSSLKSIGAFAFSVCNALRNLEFPEGLLSIGSNAFFDCSALDGLTLPDSVVAVYDAAFADCKTLDKILLPEGIKHIGAYAFSGCIKLNDIGSDLSGLEYIGMKAFDGTEFYENLDAGTVYFGKVLYAYKGYMESGKEIIIEPGTEFIAAGAFSNCQNLKEITIPDSVTELGADAFSGCISLESVDIGVGITEVGVGTFRDCRMLVEINLPAAVTAIGASAFSGCLSLDGFIIPGLVTAIEESTFLSCVSLASITFHENIEMVSDGAFIGCVKLVSVTAERGKALGITLLDVNCFEGCGALTEIIIADPDSLEEYKSADGWRGYAGIIKRPATP
jgi:hypothetical protein